MNVVSARSARTGRNGASLSDDIDDTFDAAVGEHARDLGGRRAGDSGRRHSQPKHTAVARCTVLGGPRVAGQLLEHLDDVARRDDPGRGGEDLAGLAEDVRHSGDSGEVAGERFVGKTAHHVTGVVAEHRHAVAIGEERGHHHRADLARLDGCTAVEGDHFDEPHVEIEVEVAVAARAAGHRQDFGHRERVRWERRRRRRLPRRRLRWRAVRRRRRRAGG